MALKKKKKGKKKKSSAAAKDPADAEMKPVNEVPLYLDPIRDAPKAKLKCILANPSHAFGVLEETKEPKGWKHFEIDMKISCTLYTLQ